MCCAGVYTVVQRGPRATNLVFKLEVPSQPAEVQQELAIPQEGSYGLSIKVCAKGCQEAGALGGGESQGQPPNGSAHATLWWKWGREGVSGASLFVAVEAEWLLSFRGFVRGVSDGTCS